MQQIAADKVGKIISGIALKYLVVGHGHDLLL